MSFLGKLRQQQDVSEQRLKLCYLMRYCENNGLVFSINLAELNDGRLLDPGKPYLIQREHLQHPPPFLSTEDIKLLQQLIQIDNRWLAQSHGQLLIKNPQQWLAALINTRRCFIQYRVDYWQPISLAEPIQLELAWQHQKNASYQLDWVSGQSAKVIYSDFFNATSIYYDIEKAAIGLAHNQVSDEAISLIKKFDRQLPLSDIDDFLVQYQHQWKALDLPLPEPVSCQIVEVKVEPVLLFEKGQHEANLKLVFRYSCVSYCCNIIPSIQTTSIDYWNGTQLVRMERDFEYEKDCIEQLSTVINHDFVNRKSTFCWLAKDVDCWQKLMLQYRHKLEKQGFQFSFRIDFPYHYMTAENWRLNLNELSNGDIQLTLKVQAESKAINLFDLLTELQDYNQEYKAANLDDGTILLLPAEAVSGIAEELADLLASKNNPPLLPRNQFNRLQNLTQHLPSETEYYGNTQLISLAENLYQTPAVLNQLLAGVKAKLRPYQWLGVCWLQHLKKHQANGLLADDMGLGKTLQTLAHLSLEKQQEGLKQPVLLVVPTSLLYNWSAEIEQFTPQLKYQIVHGIKRKLCWADLQNFDVLITTYQLIVKDIEFWQAHELSWLVLDEAQQIKNPRTKTSQALRLINSSQRICLSGTPVENHLGELWSLMDFLMPDSLGSLATFKQYYRKPIEIEANTKRMHELQQRIAPFILRRTKQQVATDLPEKTEVERYIELNEPQQALYDEQKLADYAELEEQLNSVENDGKKQILLLTALLKLRQICCDPELIGHSEVHSAKREFCLSMISELVAENRTILVFSQFTGMLDLLAHELNELAIPYLMLTGKTANRKKVVDDFQQGKAPVFLISLKAGGVGLNLTRADTVIHYDPWWNDAAQQQATDRAHRIGQKNPVFVYKLIAQGTIEEKIVQLQNHKAQLGQHINAQAQTSGEQFALKLEDLMRLWQEEIKHN